MDKIAIARESILNDLFRRHNERDKDVQAINPKHAHRWHEPQKNYFVGSGAVKCPVCVDGALYYSRSAYNGHVSAACITPGCVVWRE